MEIWNLIHSLQGKRLKTLDKKKSFDISYVGNDRVTVTPFISSKERHIKRSTVEDAFSELRMQGKLSRTDIRIRYSEFNPAYIAALLAEHPTVTHKVRPIVLYSHI